jgi:hypothetical protein
VFIGVSSKHVLATGANDPGAALLLNISSEARFNTGLKAVIDIRLAKMALRLAFLCHR